MCISLFYQFRKARRNRNAQSLNTQSNAARPAKQDPPCQHQLAHTDNVNDDGVPAETNPGLAHQQVRVEQRGSKHCPECRAEKKRTRIYAWKIVIALLIPNIMASMDMTIIATALPTIASRFCKSDLTMVGQSPLANCFTSRADTAQLDRHSVHAGVNVVDSPLRADL